MKTAGSNPAPVIGKHRRSVKRADEAKVRDSRRDGDWFGGVVDDTQSRKARGIRDSHIRFNS
jgi:hypothetical protein